MARCGLLTLILWISLCTGAAHAATVPWIEPPALLPAHSNTLAAPGAIPRAASREALRTAWLAAVPFPMAPVASLATPRVGYEHFRQTVAELPILGTLVSIQWKGDGVASARGRWYPDSLPADVSSTIVVSQADARTIALQGLPLPGAAAVGNGTSPEPLQWLLEERVWAPLDPGNGGTPDWRVIWRFHVVTDEAFLEAWVDANDGTLLARFSLSEELAIEGTVHGEIEPRSPRDSQVVVPFPNARLTADGADAVTDAAGTFSIDVPSLPATVEFSLAGARIRVRDGQANRAIPTADTLVSAPGPIAFVWNDSHARPSLRDAYAHGERVATYVRTLDPGPTLDPLDAGLEVWVDDPALSCNAVWDGTRLRFYEGSTGCAASARVADVVYHEYGHAVTYWITRPFTIPRDMNEAFSDYLAATITDSPFIGLGFFGNQTFVRELETDRSWPEDRNLDPHLQGLILGSALWNLREELGAEVTDQLFHFSRYAIAQSFDEYLVDLLVYDDDDGDLTNGTPHFAQIVNIFRAQGVGDYSVSLEGERIPDLEELDAGRSVRAEIRALLGLDRDSLSLFYREEGSTAFQRAPLLPTETAGIYVGEIPALTATGLVEYYYSASDTVGNRATYPADAPDMLFTFTAGPDLTPPEIEHTPIDVVTADRTSIRLDARARDNLGDLRSLALGIRVEPDGSETFFDLEPVSGPDLAGWRDYSVLVPLDYPANTTFSYRIVAEDAALSANQSTWPPNGRRSVAVKAGRFLDLESDSGGLTATGDWEWGTPEEIAPEGGTHVWATRLAGPYSNGAVSELVWGPLDFSALENARLEFRQAYRFLPGSDGGRVETSTDGVSYRSIFPATGYPVSVVAPFEGPAYSGYHETWESALFALDDLVGEDEVWLRWIARSDEFGNDLGWYVDNVTLLHAQAHVDPARFVAASGRSQQVLLTWNPPFGVDTAADGFLGYRLFRWREGENEPEQPLVETREVRYLDTGVTDEVTYRYRLHAMYASGLSLGSEATATPAAPLLAFDLDEVRYRLDGMAASDTTFFVRNLGAGVLEFDVYVGDKGSTLEDVRALVTPPELGDPPVEVLLDPADSGTVPDLSRVSLARRDGALGDDFVFTLEGHGPWGDPLEDWGGVVLLDTDQNLSTEPEDSPFDWGENLNIGWEHAVVFGSLARELGSPADPLHYRACCLSEPARVSGADFPENGNTISFAIPAAALEDPLAVQVAVFLARSLAAGPLDVAPEIPDLPWLRREPRHGRARLGRPQPFSLEFDASSIGNGRYEAMAFLTTNDPTRPRFDIPVTLDVTGFVPAEPVQRSLEVRAEGVALEVQVYLDPAPEGVRIERQEVSNQIWRTLTDEALIPDSEGFARFLDRTAVPGTEYRYRFRVRFVDGGGILYGPYEIRFAPAPPDRPSLWAVGRNPFRDSIELRLGVPTASPVQVGVFAIDGRRIATLLDAEMPAGTHPLTWTGRSDNGERAPSGIYWIRAKTPGATPSVRAILFQ